MTVYTTKDLPRLFSDYYAKAKLDVPRIHRREIAFQPWNAPGPSFRNKYYPTEEALRAQLQERPFAAVFHSVGYYLDPYQPSPSKKGLLSFDLVFDIDADNVGEEDYLDILSIVCSNAKILIDEFLVKDFGFDKDSIRIEFSGRKGLHITVLDPKFAELTKEDRRQLVDYIEGAKVEKTILFPERKGIITSPRNAMGWARFARESMVDLVALTIEGEPERNKEILAELGFAKIRQKRLGDLLAKSKVRQEVLEGRLVSLTGRGEKTLVDFQKFVFRRHNAGLGGTIDRKVTFDRFRIFRVPGSIHPKSGFPCLTIDYDSLEDPDRIFQYVAFAVGSDDIQIELEADLDVDCDYPLHLKADEVHTLPRYVALGALCQSKAQLK